MKVQGIGKVIGNSGVKFTPKNKIKIGKSGLPLEEPLDTFEKEKQYIDMLSPDYSFEQSLRTIQNKLNSLGNK